MPSSKMLDLPAIRPATVVLAGFAVVVGAALIPSHAAEPARAAVIVANTSEPVLCAERDNVTLTFTSPTVRKFRIEAAHPTYLATVQRDNWKADWTNCDFGPVSPRPAAAKPPKPPERLTIYEEPAQWLVGWRFADFWRPATATVRVGDRVETGLHLLQLWQIRPNGGEEVVVVYPQDGYWRARPLAPKGRDLTAFGSSFLIGPVDIDGRPLVRLTQIAFAPKTREFKLSFAAGGTATVKLAEVSSARTVFDIAIDRAIAGQPFAALRSMYVTDFNNDVARVAVRAPAAKGWRESPVMTFKGGEITDLWAGRIAPSQHNTSSPDIVFKGFQ